MKVNVGKVLRTFWNTIGKQSATKIMVKKVEAYLQSICKKYNMREDLQVNIAKSISDLLRYLTNAKLNKEKVDSKVVIKQIEGPIAKSLMVGASSINNSENFIAELLSKIEESDVSNVESFFSEIGMTNTSQYIGTLKDVLTCIKDGKFEETYSSTQMEEDIPYAEEINEGDYTKASVKNKSTVYEGMTAQEEDAFIQNLSGRFTGQKLTTPADVLNTINTFIKTSEDVIKFTELQKTKRTEIRAQAEIRIKEIDAMKNIIMTYLDKTFDERSKIFAKQFDCVDKALAEGDSNMLAITLNSITDLAKSSPFKALADVKNIKQQLTANNTTFDI